VATGSGCWRDDMAGEGVAKVFFKMEFMFFIRLA